MYSRLIKPPIKDLIVNGEFQFGTYDSEIENSNMLSVHRPFHYAIPNWLKFFRVKEWEAFQIGNKEFFMFCVLYAAKSFTMSIVTFYDKTENKKYAYRNIALGNQIQTPNSLQNSTMQSKLKNASINFSNQLNENQIIVDINIENKKEIKSFSAELTFNHNSKVTKPISVCLPLGMNRAMYSHKALMPTSGIVHVNGKEFILSEEDSLGILDFHKGYYPFQMHYDWLTGFGFDEKNRRIGFNLTDNQVKDQYNYNENCLWIDNTMHPLPPIKFTRPDGVNGFWIIQDTEGMVDLKFKPEVNSSLQMNALLLAADYNGPFGRFSGFITSPKGEKIPVENLYGMGEKKYLRA